MTEFKSNPGVVYYHTESVQDIHTTVAHGENECCGCLIVRYDTRRPRAVELRCNECGEVFGKLPVSIGGL